MRCVSETCVCARASAYVCVCVCGRGTRKERILHDGAVCRCSACACVCVCMRARACMSTLADSSSAMLCSSFESRNGMCASPAFTPPPLTNLPNPTYPLPTQPTRSYVTSCNVRPRTVPASLVTAPVTGKGTRSALWSSAVRLDPAAIAPSPPPPLFPSASGADAHGRPSCRRLLPRSRRRDAGSVSLLSEETAFPRPCLALR